MSSNAGGIASWRGLAAHVTLSRSLQVCASEIISSSDARNMQDFVAACSAPTVGNKQRAGPAIDRTSQNATTMECYRTVGTDHIHLSAYESSGQRSSTGCRNVERDNQVVT